MSLDNINLWHSTARPNPTSANFNVQLGCHLEEVAEMLVTLMGNDAAADLAVLAAYESLEKLANHLKAGSYQLVILPDNRKDFLDSVADQIVTGVGVGHCARMNVPEACSRVDDSNWSKYDELGRPIFDQNGKITKGPDYVKPDLTGLY